MGQKLSRTNRRLAREVAGKGESNPKGKTFETTGSIAGTGQKAG